MCFGEHVMNLQVAVAMKVVSGIYNGVHTRELDDLAAQTCA
jgi:CheY-specific phosphatase CheX